MKKTTGGAAKVTAYLAKTDAPKRKALNALRKAVKTAVPTASEAMSYGIIGYKFEGKPLVYLGFGKSHYAIYGMRRGTMRFPPEGKVPTGVLAKLIRARKAEIVAQVKGKKAVKKASRKRAA